MKLTNGRKVCHNDVTLNYNLEREILNNICLDDIALFKSLSVGEEVIIQGTKSRYGIQVEMLEKKLTMHSTRSLRSLGPSGRCAPSAG